ncbi:MAG TPA: hypothetical protein VH328_04290 [Burkholderiaceae bacterium]|nr:hypothetical protein [Burkholderiaceae bacterium]
MSLDRCYQAYGRYLVTFNRLNPILDAAIVRETGLPFAQGAIVTAAFTPKNRLTVLRALVAAGSRGDRAEVVQLLSEIAQDAKKQPILQGQAQPGTGNSLVFVRTDAAAGRPGAGAADFTAEAIDAAADELSARVDALAALLGIGEAELSSLKRAGEEVAARRRRGGILSSGEAPPTEDDSD